SRLEAENAALRHQLTVLQRKARGRIQLTNSDPPVLHSALSLVPFGPQGHHDHPARDPRALASRRFSPLLAAEIALSWRSATDQCRSAGTDPTDERRECALGCAAHTW